jgi:rubrerythrin
MERTKIKETLKHLRQALKDELQHESFFVKSSEIAKTEGFSEAAEFFRKAAKEEKQHANEIEILLDRLR